MADNIQTVTADTMVPGSKSNVNQSGEDQNTVQNQAEQESQATGNPEETQEQKRAKEKPKAQTFDEFLASGSNQAEFDRRIQKAIKTYDENRQKESEMTADEIAQKRLEEAKQALADERMTFELEKRTVGVSKFLIDNRLPESLASLIASGTKTDEEAEEIVAAIKAEWDKQISEQLKAQARQTVPKAGTANQPKKVSTIAELAQKNRKIK